MRDTAIILYTHSDYSDVWPMFFEQFEKHFPFKDIPKYVFCDPEWTNATYEIPMHWEIVNYNDSDNYTLRFSSCLEQVEEKYCIFMHEDMILYKDASKKELSLLSDLVEKYGIDFIKFLRATEVPLGEWGESVTKIDMNKTPWSFGIQPTFIRTNVLKNIYENSGGLNIWEFEESAQAYVKMEDIQGAVWWRGEEKRGAHHYDSDLWPFIATAIVKGKWNTSEYPELDTLLEDYNVDKSIRGER